MSNLHYPVSSQGSFFKTAEIIRRAIFSGGYKKGTLGKSMLRKYSFIVFTKLFLRAGKMNSLNK